MSRKHLEKRSIAKLEPHPSQAELFSDLSDVELAELAADLEANGLDHPVEILPDGTIICGHQRVAAAKRLGWEIIQCWVRSDLVENGDDAVEARLIEDNLHRRQLSPLDMARCYRRLKQLRSEVDFDDEVDGDFRDHFATRFNLSGRQLDRYLEMLDAPIEVQHAFSQPGSKVTQADVRAVTKLDRRIQIRIAKKIGAGQPAKEVIQSCLTNGAPGKLPELHWAN